MIKIKKVYQTLFPEKTVSDFFKIEGKIYKRIQNRYTLRFMRQDKSLFIKCHRGIGWSEVIKNLITFKLPVFDAGNEWHAIHRCHELGLDTMQAVGWGYEGINPVQRNSFLITESLEHTLDLESWFGGNKNRTDKSFLTAKRTLIQRVAKISRTLHENGVNHRDYYLCHLRMDTDIADPIKQCDRIPIYIMDLHRAQLRNETPQRWRVKDISGLWYSSCYGPAGLTLNRTDLIRFIKAYKGKNWRTSLKRETDLWQEIKARFDKDYQKDHSTT